MKPTKTSIAVLIGAGGVAHGQALPGILPQSTAWNSSFRFTPEQIKLGQLTPELASSVELILNFDRSQLANGGPSYDGFYKLDNTSTNATPQGPGEVLKVQQFTDPAVYNLPAQIAISRILYSTTNLNGTLIPASAAVLWPYTPGQFSNRAKHDSKQNSSCSAAQNKAPVVLWAHGTSGFYADGAPSAHRSLFYGDIVPFTLAQAGYVVVAPDYAGLGIDTSWDGSFVPHQYLARQAGAADALNSVRAVRKTWGSSVTDEYVVLGHSQGGAVSWGVSELLAQMPSEYKDLEQGHLGTVVFNPASGEIFKAATQLFIPWLSTYLSGVFPTFSLSDWLTPLGIARTQLLSQIKGGQYVSMALFANQSQSDIVNPAWNETWYQQAATVLANPGKQPFKGPMILFEGGDDTFDGLNRNTALFDATCPQYGDDFEFVVVANASHFPTMDAARQQWLKWIEDRFEGKKTPKGCVKSELKSFLPAGRYQVQRKSFYEWSGTAEWFYQLPAA
jgi:pimeloyl-ACP methyl ester carboxylesterase